MQRPAHRLRLVFAGTPDFAVPCLEACLASGAELAAIYTQPDRPAGRGRKLTASPVKQAALAAGIAVEQPGSLKTAAARARLAAHAPDLLVVVAYGLILPRKVLAIPARGCWNVHASVLPRWRGAAPIQRAILAGDAETGVALMRMEAGLDTGPVLLERRTPIRANDTGGSLHDRLAQLGAEVLADGLARVMAGESLPESPQPETGAVYAHKLDKAEGVLDFALPAAELARKVRAFDPWPGCSADIAGEHLRIWRSEDRGQPAEVGQQRTENREQKWAATSGSIVAVSRAGIDIACGKGILRITELQRPGGRRMPAAAWLNARPNLRHA